MLSENQAHTSKTSRMKPHETGARAEMEVNEGTNFNLILQSNQIPITQTYKLHHSHPPIHRFLRNFVTLLILHTILSHLSQLINYITYSDNTVHQHHLHPSRFSSNSIQQHYSLALPKIILAGAVECNIDSDCGSNEKICHDSKCICSRERPIEDQGRCLELALISQACSITEQCLGNSICIDGACNCGNDAVALFNPSTSIYYCHPKRKLNEECNYDYQCPSNSYCSTNKNGCLCHNGFGPSMVNNAGIESLECLAKFCTASNSCESDFHTCEDNKCKCLASHFDPTSAKCYKFGSTGGKPANETGELSDDLLSKPSDDNSFYSILKDLSDNSDKMWLKLVILVLVSLVLLLIVFLLVRKYCFACCWRAYKNEYEPNNKNPSKNGYFMKDSINNKSFRRKSGELDEDDADHDDSSADISNLVAPKVSRANDYSALANDKDQSNSYIKVNMSDNDSSNDVMNNYVHQLGAPLKTSTSTPV